MTPTHASSSTLSWLAIELVLSLVASSGGIIVFYGLWVEKKAIKEHYQNAHEVRQSKRMEERGWKILMIGIGVEIVVGFAFAAKDGWEIREINNEISKINPLHQQVTDIVANAKVVLLTTNDWSPCTGPLANWVELLETSASGTTARTLFLGGFQRLLENECEGFGESDATGKYQGFSIHFRPDRLLSLPQNGFVLQDRSPMTASHVLDKISTLSFHLDSIPKDTEIIRGSAEIIINGAFRKEFPVMRQRPATNSPAGAFYAITTGH